MWCPLITLGLVANLGLALSVLTHGQLPFTSPESTINEDFPIVSEDTVKYFDHLRRRYGIKGLSIAVVASPTHTGEGWLNQTISLGEANVEGSPVTDQVSPLSSIRADYTDVVRYCIEFEIVHLGRNADPSG